MFATAFGEAKTRVRQMDLRLVEENVTRCSKLCWKCYPTGGESGNYGDFVDDVTAANVAFYADMAP